MSNNGLFLTKLSRIQNPKGDILHALKCSDKSFSGFGEVYFTEIKKDQIKGWKKHSEMIMNLIVPIGTVKFYVWDNVNKKGCTASIGDENYARLTIPKGNWVAFSGRSNYNLVLNVGSIEHDPSESQNVDLETFPINEKFYVDLCKKSETTNKF